MYQIVKQIEIMTLKQLFELSEKHPYYSSDSNYYSNDHRYTYNTFDDFLNEMGDADLDMNLVFRWDVCEDDFDGHYLQIFIIQQRKGIYCSHTIEGLDECDVPKILEYLKPRKEKLQELWNV